MSKILRRRDVQERTGLPRSTLYDKMNAGDFPRPIPLGDKAVGWLEAEVEEWIGERTAARDAA